MKAIQEQVWQDFINQHKPIRQRSPLILSGRLSDFFASVGKFVTSSLAFHSIHWDHTDFQSDVCEVLGFTEQFFTMSANIWVLYIAVYLYRLIVKKRDSMKYVTAFQLSAWGISFVTAISTFSEHVRKCWTLVLAHGSVCSGYSFTQWFILCDFHLRSHFRLRTLFQREAREFSSYLFAILITVYLSVNVYIFT